MKKAAAFTLSIFLLAGCAAPSGSLSASLEQRVDEAAAQTVSVSNNRKQFYSYYIDPSIGKVSSTSTGNVFSCDGSLFVMNLDVPGIINAKYYPDAAASEVDLSFAEVMAEKEGTCTDASGNEIPYSVTVSKLDTGQFITVVRCNHVMLYGICDEAYVPNLAARMLVISRTVTVNTEEVLLAYSKQEKIDYIGTPVQLFEEIPPENGSIQELLTDYPGAQEPQEDSEAGPEDAQEAGNGGE